MIYEVNLEECYYFSRFLKLRTDEYGVIHFKLQDGPTWTVYILMRKLLKIEELVAWYWDSLDKRETKNNILSWVFSEWCYSAKTDVGFWKVDPTLEITL